MGGFQRLALAAIVLMLAATFAFLYTEADEARRAAAPAQRAAKAAAREHAFELHRQKRYSEAAEQYDKLVGEASVDAELLYWRGVARHHLRRLDDALADFRRAMELEPGRFDAHLAADRVLSEQRRFEECVSLWNRYLERQPGDMKAIFERGGAQFHLGNRTEALADARLACDLGHSPACTVARELGAKMGQAK